MSWSPLLLSLRITLAATLILAVVGVVIQAETMSLQGIVRAQADGEIFGFGAMGNPFIITQFVGFLIFLIAVQAELTQTPFDMPVAESELVSGYMTEYTGFRFLFFFMAEFGTAFALAAIAATLYLGGWSVPLVDSDSNLANFLGPLALGGKIMLVEPFASDRVEENLNTVGRLYYSGSTALCTPASLSQEVGLGLGDAAGQVLFLGGQGRGHLFGGLGRGRAVGRQHHPSIRHRGSLLRLRVGVRSLTRDYRAARRCVRWSRRRPTERRCSMTQAVR